MDNLIIKTTLAKEIGIHRNTLVRYLDYLGIKPIIKDNRAYYTYDSKNILLDYMSSHDIKKELKDRTLIERYGSIDNYKKEIGKKSKQSYTDNAQRRRVQNMQKSYLDNEYTSKGYKTLSQICRENNIKGTPKTLKKIADSLPSVKYKSGRWFDTSSIEVLENYIRLPRNEKLKYFNNVTYGVNKPRLDSSIEKGISKIKESRKDFIASGRYNQQRKLNGKPLEDRGWIPLLNNKYKGINSVRDILGLEKGKDYDRIGNSAIYYSKESYMKIEEYYTNRKNKNNYGEFIVSKVLSELNVEFEQQKYFRDCKDKKYLPFDFYLKDYNILIEIDGQQHYKPTSFGDSALTENEKLIKYKDRVNKDKIKTDYCTKNNIKLIRIPWLVGEVTNSKLLIKRLNEELKINKII